MLAAPRNQGSTLAASASSDSERLNPRVAGPTDTLPGNCTPVITYLAGSCDVRVYCPDRIRAIAGLKALVAPTDGAATTAGGLGALGAGVAAAPSAACRRFCS